MYTGQQRVSSGDGSNDVNRQRVRFLHGRDGLPGRDGRDGPPGSPGFPGFPGHKGEPGLQGQVGKKGERGIHGDQGPQGNVGPPGTKGERGLSGLTGSPGLPGHKGEPGPRGQVGEKGKRGFRGDAGPQGTSGPQGNSGLQGVAGPKGDMGPPGRNGLRGLPGPTGPQGVVGPKGDMGPPGIKGAKGSPSPLVGGVTYTRWGKSSCRSGVNLVYAGRTGRSKYNNGGGADDLCMPNNPQYSNYRPGVQGYSHVYGVEYEDTITAGGAQHNAPCAVCNVPDKSTTIMIPARLDCPTGWTREYYGYLMTERYSHSLFECVDVSMEAIPGTLGHHDGGHLYHVEAVCSGIPCGPYNNYKELTCAVCSK